MNLTLNPKRWLDQYVDRRAEQRLAAAIVESRSGTSAPDQWLVDWVRGDSSGGPVSQERALKIAAVWACVRNISEDEAKIPLVTYKRLDRGKERATDHAIYTLLRDAPNEDQSAFDWRSTMMQYALLRGNAYAEIVRDGGGNVLALTEPLDPARVTPKRDGAGQIYYEVKNDAGTAVPVSQDRIFHLKGMGDGLVGYSILAYARHTLGGSLDGDEFANSFYGNGLNVSGVLKHPKILTEKAQSNLRKSMEDVHKGTKNAGKLMILEEGMDYMPISITPHDAQFLETRQFSVVEVCRWFRMPPHKIAELTRATFSNIEQQSIEYVGDTLMPWFVRFEQEISRKLLRPAERKVYFAEHLADALLRGDIASRYAAYAVGRNNGWLNGDDIREKENMNPMPDGDKYLINGNMIPVSTAAKATVKADMPPAPGAVDNNQRFAAHEQLLADAFQRVLNIEVDRARSALRKSQLAEWRPKFYEQHLAHVENSIGTVCRAISAISDPNCTQIGPVSDLIKQISRDHCAKSELDAVDDERIGAWSSGHRAREQAVDAIKRIIEVTTNG